MKKHVRVKLPTPAVQIICDSLKDFLDRYQPNQPGHTVEEIVALRQAHKALWLALEDARTE